MRRADYLRSRDIAIRSRCPRRRPVVTTLSPPRRLAPMERLDASAIALPGIEVRVLERCTSTNDLLLAAGQADVLLAAEHQTAGRGRRGRRWHAAARSAVTFSLSRLVHRPPRELPGLALVAGVGV